MAAAKQIAFNAQRLIDEVAARHRLLLKPDDAAFAIVTMNRLVLEESLEAVHSRILEDLALFEAAAQEMQTRAGSVLAAEVRESAAGIRKELVADIQDARLEASRIVRPVEEAYQQPISAQKLTIAALAAALLFFGGVWAGRISALWWPL
jgi:CHASE3 domain sensor protein